MVIQDTCRRINGPDEGMRDITILLPEYILYINPSDCCIIPHFHVKRRGQEDRDSFQVSLCEPRFFEHTTNCQHPHRSCVDELVEYLMSTIDGKTNWKFLVGRWKRTQKCLLLIPDKCPDYSLLLQSEFIRE